MLRWGGVSGAPVVRPLSQGRVARCEDQHGYALNNLLGLSEGDGQSAVA